jgi:hypothetical protein
MSLLVVTATRYSRPRAFIHDRPGSLTQSRQKLHEARLALWTSRASGGAMARTCASLAKARDSQPAARPCAARPMRACASGSRRRSLLGEAVAQTGSKTGPSISRGITVVRSAAMASITGTGPQVRAEIAPLSPTAARAAIFRAFVQRPPEEATEGHLRHLAPSPATSSRPRSRPTRARRWRWARAVSRRAPVSWGLGRFRLWLSSHPKREGIR